MRLPGLQTLRDAIGRVWPSPYTEETGPARSAGRPQDQFFGQVPWPSPEPWPAEGPGRDGVVVLDASHSMLSPDWPPSRLEAAKDAARAYVERLANEEPGARVAVVAYGTYAELVCPLVPVGQLSLLFQYIDSLQPMGSTNFSAALYCARQALLEGRDELQGILLSDGHNNDGVDPRPLADDLKQRAVIECVGIGGRRSDVQEDLMRELASAYPDGSKRYHWIGDSRKLRQHFHDLAGRISRT